MYSPAPAHRPQGVGRGRAPPPPRGPSTRRGCARPPRPGRDAPGDEGAQRGDARGQDGRLRVRGELQLLLRALEAEPREGEARGRRRPPRRPRGSPGRPRRGPCPSRPPASPGRGRRTRRSCARRLLARPEAGELGLDRGVDPARVELGRGPDAVHDRAGASNWPWPITQQPFTPEEGRAPVPRPGRSAGATARKAGFGAARPPASAARSRPISSRMRSTTSSARSRTAFRTTLPVKPSITTTSTLPGEDVVPLDVAHEVEARGLEHLVHVARRGRSPSSPPRPGS